MSYNLNTEKVLIEDEGYLFVVTNKETGERAVAKNYCGYVNRKMSFALTYPKSKDGLCDIAQGRPEALSKCLRNLGLPTFYTLRKGQSKKIVMQI